MKYYLLISILLITFSCKNNEVSSVLEVEKKIIPISDTLKTVVEIKLSPLSSSDKKSDNDKEILENVWVAKDSLLIIDFLESIISQHQINFSKYLNLFGEQSEYEIEELILKFGDKAEEQSMLLYSDALNHNSLILNKIEKSINGDIGGYESIILLQFIKKEVDINYFRVKLKGKTSIIEYEILTNSSEGKNHYIVDILKNKRSIINNQSY